MLSPSAMFEIITISQKSELLESLTPTDHAWILTMAVLSVTLLLKHYGNPYDLIKEWRTYSFEMPSLSCYVSCSGEPLTVQAPGTQTRSFCYVSDMVRILFLHFCLTWYFTQNFWHFIKVDGLIRLMEGDNTGPINLGNPGNFNDSLVI